jgi:UDPglucose 6-dehydrogenase
MLREQCGGAFAGRRIAVLGAAFKPDTDDIRDSPALQVASAIRHGGGEAAVYDPQAMDNARREFPDLRYECSAQDAARDADAVALLTSWPEFAVIDAYLLGQVVRNRNVVDARHVLDPAAWQRAGWNYSAPGRPALQARPAGLAAEAG